MKGLQDVSDETEKLQQILTYVKSSVRYESDEALLKIQQGTSTMESVLSSPDALTRYIFDSEQMSTFNGVIRRQAGDCDDHATYFMGLAERAGISIDRMKILGGNVHYNNDVPGNHAVLLIEPTSNASGYEEILMLDMNLDEPVSVHFDGDKFSFDEGEFYPYMAYNSADIWVWPGTHFERAVQPIALDELQTLDHSMSSDKAPVRTIQLGRL